VKLVACRWVWSRASKIASIFAASWFVIVFPKRVGCEIAPVPELELGERKMEVGASMIANLDPQF